LDISTSYFPPSAIPQENNWKIPPAANLHNAWSRVGKEPGTLPPLMRRRGKNGLHAETKETFEEALHLLSPRRLPTDLFILR
jgi:hypothetical protein